MTPVQRDHLGRHLPSLREAWAIMLTNSAVPLNIDWAEALARRHEIDPLADHAWAAGYIVGVADALGISVEEALQVLRTEPKTSRTRRRRTIRVNRPKDQRP